MEKHCQIEFNENSFRINGKIEVLRRELLAEAVRLGGKKLDKGAYVEVKVLGSVDSGASSKMTAKVCEILDKELGIPGDAIYVSYFGTSNWGWNGSNF